MQKSIQNYKHPPIYKPYFYYNRPQLNRIKIINHAIYQDDDLYYLSLAQFFDRLAVNHRYDSYFELWNSNYPASDKLGQGFVKRIIKEYNLKLDQNLTVL